MDKSPQVDSDSALPCLWRSHISEKPEDSPVCLCLSSATCWRKQASSTRPKWLTTAKRSGEIGLSSLSGNRPAGGGCRDDCLLSVFLLDRKNWSQSWTVLHGGILTFHKDPKSAPTGNAVRTFFTRCHMSTEEGLYFLLYRP